MDANEHWESPEEHEDADGVESSESETEDESGSSSDGSASSASSDEEDEEADDSQLLADLNEMGPEASGIASLLAVNQAYLELIERLSLKKKIKESLANRDGGESAFANQIRRALFFPPYIKDENGMVPAMNEDSKEIQQICSYNLLMKKERTWSADECRQLRTAVVNQLKFLQTRELVARRDVFRQKVANFTNADGLAAMAKWKDELAAIERRLEYIRNLSETAVLKSATYDEIDWKQMAVRDFACLRTWLQLKMKWLNEQAPHWNHEPWTEKEDELLKTYGQNLQPNWDIVAARLGTSRTPYSCFERFLVLQKALNVKRAWTAEEDQKLVSLVQTFTTDNHVNWRRIAAHMPNRTRDQCEVRYNRSLDARLNHGRWVDSEDLLLLSAVNKYGPHDWARIANMVPGRTSVQCRARWVDNLDQKRNDFPWTADEDEAVLLGITVFGRNNYSAIAKMIPRPEHAAYKGEELRRPEAAHLIEVFNAKRKAAFERFSHVVKMSAVQNHNSMNLAQRIGHGNYVMSAEGAKTSDYSAVRQELSKEFGKWVITRCGKWVRAQKNPNEFGEEERRKVLQSLPEEKRKKLKGFFDDRARQLEEAARARQEGTADIAALNRVDDAQMRRIGQMMEHVIKIEQSDIDSYRNTTNRRNRRKAPKLSTRKRRAPAPRKPRYRVSLRKKLAANFSALISDFAVPRYTMGDRLTDEICHNIKQLPQEERRNFILRSMCEVLTRQLEYTAAKEMNAQICQLLEVQLYTYLEEKLRMNMFVDEAEESGPSTSTAVVPARGPRTLDLPRIFSNLLPPSIVSINMLSFFKTAVQKELLSRARLLFTPDGRRKKKTIKRRSDARGTKEAIQRLNANGEFTLYNPLVCTLDVEPPAEPEVKEKTLGKRPAPGRRHKTPAKPLGNLIHSQLKTELYSPFFNPQPAPSFGVVANEPFPTTTAKTLSSKMSVKEYLGLAKPAKRPRKGGK
ncbi:hypothetical protein M3Y99_00083400 [Aphelenchoides fujianensis]|nr:hypothetical protein M3Y99_00083400 [Aphelenchoides fujianensis]